MTNDEVKLYIEDAKQHHRDGMITRKEMVRRIAALEATIKAPRK